MAVNYSTSSGEGKTMKKRWTKKDYEDVAYAWDCFANTANVITPEESQEKFQAPQDLFLRLRREAKHLIRPANIPYIDTDEWYVTVQLAAEKAKL